MQIALIPARGGSKGVPGKNIRDLAGKPLIAYTIEAARDAALFDEIFVSTDDEKIAAVAIQHGVSVPFLRPSELSGDTAPMLAVIRHVIDHFKGKALQPRTIVLLQPTCPFRTAEDIKEALSIFSRGDYDSLVSVLEVPDKYNPCWVYVENEEGGLKLFNGEAQPIARRQDLPKAYIREGSIYIFKADTVEAFGNIYGEKIGYYPLRRKTVNIDTMDDFREAEVLMLTQQKAKEV